MGPILHTHTHAAKLVVRVVHLALVANGKQELQETLDEWNGLFTRHGLKLRIDKAE